MDRQGFIGDLDDMSIEELCELLSRQEKILQNKRFIQKLPDKGKKIFGFVARIRHVLANKEEEESKQASLASVQTEFQARYEQAFTQRQHLVFSDAGTMREQSDVSLSRVNTDSSSTAAPSNSVESDRSSGSVRMKQFEVSGNSSADAAAKHTDLIDAFERVTLSEEMSHRKAGPNSPSPNPFSVQPPKKPHYIEVLEKSQTNLIKPRFKPSRNKSDCPLHGQSPGGLAPLSIKARRERDRKHLDDITAAKLPPLHYNPAQLLSLEESVTLLQDQTKKYQELQAKLAAQKLAEGLAVSMNSYNPEGGALAAYREVHDDENVPEED